MSTETVTEDTWETDEICRHIVNDEGLYDEVQLTAEGNEMAADEVAELVRETLNGVDGMDGFDWSEVDWESVVEYVMS